MLLFAAAYTSRLLHHALMPSRAMLLLQNQSLSLFNDARGVEFWAKGGAGMAFRLANLMRGSCNKDTTMVGHSCLPTHTILLGCRTHRTQLLAEPVISSLKG